MKGIYKFYWDYGRHGEVSGIFIAEDWQIKDLIGEHVYFGEILGKHSQVEGYIEEGDITLISQNPDFVQMFKEHIGKVGYNPVEYYYNNYEDFDEDELEDE